LIAGCGVVIAAAPALQPVLYATSLRDPAVVFGAVALVALVSIVAIWTPVRRALAGDPSTVLRDG
jgi:hypothetical protein